VTEQVQTLQLQSAVVGGNSWSRVINTVPSTFRHPLFTNSRRQIRSDITRYAQNFYCLHTLRHTPVLRSHLNLNILSSTIFALLIHDTAT